ncbi:ricin-type beta-trefoil lectin domain protein [Neiella sp. HB171785]|uniref:Ricin-type beta-trefoil lectin domain protein n=1 Tax=Neiella litorisoli TaxID=2771431 RepID=A0A8J6R3K2_9GAMM|nr:ricin-type beta-trefoil lectin domain protein [Neiella litorisoli]MBD1390460.1 ricin-type beta-trefoil lectin domain protein [Neiella litorisoli]
MKTRLKATAGSLLLTAFACPALGATVIQQSTSGMCLRTADGSASPSNGTEVVLHSDCSGEAAQFNWTSGGSIQHSPSGRCIHPGGAAIPENGQKLVLWDGCDFADRVRFSATNQNSMQHLSSNKCVHPNGGSANPADNTNLVMWEGCNEDRLAFTVETQGASGGGSVQVAVNLDTKHAVGAEYQFDRRKFITIHATHTENDWFGGNVQSRYADNEDANLMDNFLDTYDVYFGRDTGGMAYQLSQAPEDANKPGYASAEVLTTNGGNTRWIYSEDTSAQRATMRRHAHRDTESIVGAQQHPYYPDGTEVGSQGWSFSQTDTANEPFGTATGDFMAQYLTKFFKQIESDPYGEKKPTYVEVMNEPLFELVDYPAAGHQPASIYDIFRMHNSVANKIRETNPDVLIGGYTVAFPDYEKNNFNNWATRDKYFLDLAGGNMDFISIHLYDFPNIPYPDGTKRVQYRKGSNVEATLDLLEQYMAYKWGSIKPIVISEYGSQLQGSFNLPWSPERDWLCLKAMNSLLMNFLERPNRIEKAIPFIPVKAEWGRISESIPYYWRLMRQKFEGQGETGDEWVFTDQVKFYQLWADVNGQRVDTAATDLDIQVDAYVDGKDVYLILNSLEFDATSIDLNMFGNSGNAVTNVQFRHLYPDAQSKPQLAIWNQASLPDTVTLGSESTLIVKVSYQNVVAINHSSQETKHYAVSEGVKAISAWQTQSYSINNVDKGNYGEAVLRIGMGRDHGASLTPTVLVNGTQVAVPTDFRGYDQYHNGIGRDRFFGVIEIPVPYNILSANNTIKVTFPDSGGHVSSVTLQHFKQSKVLGRM